MQELTKITPQRRESSKVLAGTVSVPGSLRPILALGLSVLAAIVWSYWATIASLSGEWWNNDDYSVGMLVPLVAVYLVWRNRSALRESLARPCWWGLVVIVLALAARAYGLMFLFESAERYSLVLAVWGLVLLIGGWRFFLRSFWILLFLFLMVPLPGRLHNMVSGPLQSFATQGAVFMLEVIGIAVNRQGNVISLGQNTTLAVAEACSGLRMLTAFIVVTAAMAFLVKRPAWQKAALLVSSVPIAVACNIVRLCVTAVLYMHTSSEMAEKFFHDGAGLTMMPIAVFLLLGELWLLNKLVVPEQTRSSRGRQGPQSVASEHSSGHRSRENVRS